MTDTTNNTPTLPEGMGLMTNMDQLAFLIGQWFENGHAQAKLAYDVPDGQPVTITFEKDGQPEELILTGDLLKGFKAGIIVMANIFGELPFQRVAPAPVEAPSDTEGSQTADLKLVASNDEPASGN